MSPFFALRPSSMLPYGALFLAPLLWAGNFVVGRAVSGIDPFALNFLRWLVAGLCLAPLLLWHARQALRALQTTPWALLTLALLGVAGFNTTLYAGLERVTAGAASVLFGIAPLLILFLSRVWEGQAVSWQALCGALMALTGVLALLGGGTTAGEITLLGAALVALAALIFAAYTVALRRLTVPLRGDVCLALTIWLGLAVMAPGLLWHPMPLARVMAEPGTLAAVLYLGLAASVVAFYAWQHGVRQLDPQRAGVFLQLIPVFGVTLGALLLHETLSVAMVSGLVLVILGVLLAQSRARGPVARTGRPLRLSRDLSGQDLFVNGRWVARLDPIVPRRAATYDRSYPNLWRRAS